MALAETAPAISTSEPPVHIIWKENVRLTYVGAKPSHLNPRVVFGEAIDPETHDRFLLNADTVVINLSTGEEGKFPHAALRPGMDIYANVTTAHYAPKLVFQPTVA